MLSYLLMNSVALRWEHWLMTNACLGSWMLARQLSESSPDVPTNPLPLIARTEVNNKQESSSERGGLYSQRIDAVGAHLVVHPLCRRIVTVPLHARTMR